MTQKSARHFRERFGNRKYWFKKFQGFTTSVDRNVSNCMHEAIVNGYQWEGSVKKFNSEKYEIPILPIKEHSWSYLKFGKCILNLIFSSISTKWSLLCDIIWLYKPLEI